MDLGFVPSRWTRGIVALLLIASPQAFAQSADEALLADAALRGPAVAAVLDVPRETPAQQVLAMLTLLDLGEQDLAAALWNSSGQADFDDDSCAALAAKFGTARLLQLARQETPAGEEPGAQFAGARAFVDRCLKIASERARDPQRLAKLIANLNDPTDAARRAARVDLAATGTAGAAAGLEALAQSEDEAERANLMLGLTSLQPEIEPLLLAALADGKGHFRRDAAELAGYLRVESARPWLAAAAAGLSDEPAMVTAAIAALQKMNLPVPTPQEARTLFRNELDRLERGVSPDHRPAAEAYQWWTFDPNGNKYAARELSAADVQVMAIARLTRSLANLPGAADEDRKSFLIYAYQVSQVLGIEPDEELQQFATSLGPEQLGETLEQAVHEDRVAAAIACAKLLGQQANSEAFRASGFQASPLAAAVGHADRELRYVALEAIMKLAPQTTFAGASHVPLALWEFAAGAGAPQAVAASSIAIRGSDWAGQLREKGYDATPTTSGSQTLAVAIESPRLGLMLIDSDIGRPLLREVVFQLRSHYRTRRVPIAVLSSLPNLDQSRRIAERDEWLIAAPRPYEPVAMAEILDQLNKLGSPPGSPEQRTKRAVQALTWIGQLLENGHPYDELLRGASVLEETVYVPELVEPSLRALTIIGTAGSQQTLVDLASQDFQPIELRERAAAAFATSVERFGKQLTAAEVHRQYDRYNASATADEATQQVLGRVLDVIEEKKFHAKNPGDEAPGLRP